MRAVSCSLRIAPNKEGKGRDRQVGAPLHPRDVTRVLAGLLTAAKLPHDLRHSAASLLLASGVELVEVSKLLGHAEPRVTADLYAHLQKQTAAKAAMIMDSVFSG
jgi:integrase